MRLNEWKWVIMKAILESRVVEIHLTKLSIDLSIRDMIFE